MIDFGKVEEGKTGYEKTLTISNTHTSSIDFSCAVDCDWISLGQATITVASGGSSTLVLTLDTILLDPAVHTCTLTLSPTNGECNGDIADTIKVTIIENLVNPDAVCGVINVVDDGVV